MSRRLIVRRAGAADACRLSALAHLAHSSGPPFQTACDVARFLADPSNFQIVAEEENRLMSSVTMMYHPWNDSYELGRGFTRPDCRRRGLDALLLQRVLDCVCDAALGEVFIGSLRTRCLVDLCAALNPPMIVAGHDIGRTVADGSRGENLITLSIPEHARFVHVTPPVAESDGGAFIRERIYRPLRLPLAPGEYPPESLVGATSDWSLECGTVVVDYNPTSPNRALTIVGARARSVIATHLCRDVDRLLRALPHVEHIIVTVLADKTDLFRQLSGLGFELVAYLPAWYKGGAFRYDCLQLVLRRSGAKPAAQDYRNPLSRLQREMTLDRRSIRTGARRPPHRSTSREDLDMSPLTIAGLPVLAIIEDTHAAPTGNARRRAEEPELTCDLQTPGRKQSSGKASRWPERVAENGMKRMVGLLGVGMLVTATAFVPVRAAANPACNALIAGNVKLTADMNCTASATHGLRLSANATLNCAGFTITGPDRSQPNGASTGHYGLRASNVGGIRVENCNVTGYERGLYFSSVHSGFVKHSNFYGNTRYGAHLVGPDSYDMQFDANTYYSNGDEGIHISGPMNNGLTKPNTFTNSTARGNIGEGFYLLNANNVELDVITAFDNGLAGVYVKQSPNVTISHAHLIGDMMHISGNSDAGAYSWVTIEGGRLKLQKDNGTAGSPSDNTFDHICVLYDPVNGQPEAAFYFEGVTAGRNTITNSKAALIAGKNSVVAINTTTGNEGTSLYISPPTITARVDVSSSFTLTTQTATPPLCY
jgi:Right handed beta helix region